MSDKSPYTWLLYLFMSLFRHTYHTMFYLLSQQQWQVSRAFLFYFYFFIFNFFVLLDDHNAGLHLWSNVDKNERDHVTDILTSRRNLVMLGIGEPRICMYVFLSSGPLSFSTVPPIALLSHAIWHGGYCVICVGVTIFWCVLLTLNISWRRA
jgi:hypothetical protein